MKNVFTKGASFLLVAVLSAAASAADAPIGALTVTGKAVISAGDATFTLTDQEYAYFSGDVIETAKDSQSVITTNDGLQVAFSQSSVASITQEGGVYTIDLTQGSMAVDGRQGSEYRLTRNGEPVAGADQYVAGDKPYVAAVAPGENEVRFYMPAQMAGDTKEDERGRLWIWVVTAAGGAWVLASTLDDDDDPSS